MFDMLIVRFVSEDGEGSKDVRLEGGNYLIVLIDVDLSEHFLLLDSINNSN